MGMSPGARAELAKSVSSKESRQKAAENTNGVGHTDSKFPTGSSISGRHENKGPTAGARALSSPVDSDKGGGSWMPSGVGSALGSAVAGSFKKGGRVKKTGNYRVHKGERVVKRGGRRR